MHRRTLDSNNKISLETFEDEVSVIRNSKSKKDRQHNDQKKMVKTNNGWQNTTQRPKVKQQERHQKRIEISCPDD
jgi:hypothetical protein